MEEEVRQTLLLAFRNQVTTNPAVLGSMALEEDFEPQMRP
jgi:hypothetical protein